MIGARALQSNPREATDGSTTLSGAGASTPLDAVGPLTEKFAPTVASVKAGEMAVMFGGVAELCRLAFGAIPTSLQRLRGPIPFVARVNGVCSY